MSGTDFWQDTTAFPDEDRCFGIGFLQVDVMLFDEISKMNSNNTMKMKS
jgi:hypothetical protein